MRRQSRKSVPENPSPRVSLTRNDWINVARQILIKGGASNLKVRQMSSALGVSTGAFYWLFKNLEELCSALREDWATRNTEPLARSIETAGTDAWDQYFAITMVFVEEDVYDPAYDNAIRDWANTSPATEEKLREIDACRIDLYRGIFSAMGYSGAEAEIRARVCYYHQVGYQVMRVKETTEQRLANEPLYTTILTGKARPVKQA